MSIRTLGITLIIIVILCVWLGNPIKHRDKEPLGYTELSITYRNYIVSDKYLDDDEYIFHLTNPVTKSTYKVRVRDHVFMCNYFVGDTIKK